MLQRCGAEAHCRHFISTHNCDGCNMMTALNMAIEALSEPKTGHWIPVTEVYKSKDDEFPYMHIEWEEATEPDEIDAVKCSECGEVFDFADARNWCTQCGARMRGEEE